MNPNMKKVTYSKYLSVARSAIDSGAIIVMKGVKVSMPENIAKELFNVTSIQAVLLKTIVGAKVVAFSNGLGVDHRLVGRTISNELVSYIVDGVVVGVGDITLLHRYIKQYCPIDMALGTENTILRNCRAILHDGNIIIM